MTTPQKITLYILVTLMAIYLAYNYRQKIAPSLYAGTKTAVNSPQCDSSLWNHVYTGDKRRFSTPQDRLKIIKDCVTVAGIIETAVKEPDGDFHIRLKLDSQFNSMLNAKNISGQRGDLVLEPVCENAVTQKDTLEEGACNGYVGHFYNKFLLGKHVSVTGTFVLDEEHGWQEIHPVTSIILD